jgi:hypothetical protein
MLLLKWIDFTTRYESDLSKPLGRSEVKDTPILIGVLLISSVIKIVLG